MLLLGSTTDTFTNRQPTARKRRNMTPRQVDAYNEALDKQGLLHPQGPFRLLDMFALTHGEPLVGGQQAAVGKLPAQCVDGRHGA